MADNRYNFTNSAASASDALAQFLVQQQALKRQAMLDDLNTKVQQAQIANSTENTRGLAAQRQALEDEQKFKLASGVAGVLQPNQDINANTASTLNEGHLGQLVQAPPTQDGIPQIPVSDLNHVTDARLPSTRFAGTPAQLEKQKQDAAKEAYLNDPSVPTHVKDFIRAQVRTGDSSLPFELFQDPKTTLPASAQEYEYAVKHDGYKGTYAQYQTEDANRKKSTSTSNFTINTNDPAQSQALDMVAKRFAETGDASGLGRGGLQSEFGQAVAKRAAQYDKASGQFVTGVNPNPPDLAANKQAYGADTASYKALQGNLDAVSAFTKTAERNSKMLRDAMDKVPNYGAPFLNTPIRDLSVSVYGNATVSDMRVLLKSTRAEYARILNTANLSGVLTDSARQEMDTLLGDGATPEMIHHALDTLKREADNRQFSYQSQIDEIKGRHKGNGAAAPSANRIVYDSNGNPVKQ